MRPLLIGFFVCINIHLGYAQWTEQDSIWLKDVLAGKDSIKLNPEFQKAIQSGSFLNPETGLEVDNITYFGNQPWPYPSGLMVGFVADYVSGEIKLQDEELSSGAFYTKDNLPEIPRKLSLARKLIDWWLDHQ